MTRATTKTHQCRAFRCQEQVSVKKLFCEAHWARLPRRMQEGMTVSVNNPGAHEALQLCIAFIKRVETYHHE